MGSGGSATMISACPQDYYDVTNFYYEIEDPDEDIVDENGEIVEKGLRKFGVCKEEWHQPIVQIGRRCLLECW